MFDEKESGLLDAAYQIFVGRTHVFDVLSEKKWESAGIENWIQIEYAIGLSDRGYDVSVKGKLKRDCDLIVKKGGLDVGIELAAVTSGYYPSLTDRLRRHPRAELYLFVSKANEKILRGLDDYFDKNGYVEKQQ